MNAYGPNDLANPALTSEVLVEIVNTQPELWTAVLVHPNCGPDLALFLRQHLPTVVVPQVTQAPQAPQMLKGFPNAAAAQTQQGNASVEQMSAGAKQMAAGAKEYFVQTVAPAAKRAGASLQSAANEQRSSAQERDREGDSGHKTGPQTVTDKLRVWAPTVIPVLAFIAIMSPFLPIGSVSAYGFSASPNYFDDEAGGEGFILLVLFLMVIAGSIFAVLTRKRWARITAACLGIVFGVLGAIDGFGTMAAVSNSSGASVGIGAVLLAISSTGIVVGAILTILPQRN